MACVHQAAVHEGLFTRGCSPGGALPWHDDPVRQLIAIDDIGPFTTQGFAQPDAYLGRAMETTGDKLTAPQIAGALSTAAGRPVSHTQIPVEVLWDHSPAAAKVYTWANETFSDTDLASLREAFGDLMDFNTWLEWSGRVRLLAQLEACQRDRHGHMRHRQAHQPPHPRSPR